MQEKIPTIDSLMKRAIQALDMGMFEPAKQKLLQALANDPENAEAEAILAFVLFHQKQYESAEFHIKNALLREPDDAHFHYVYSLICRLTHQEIKGEQEILTAIRLAPFVSDYHSEYSLLLFKNGQLDKAEAVAKNALSLNPYDEMAMMVLGLKGVENYKVDEAQAVFRQQLTQNPQSTVAHNGMAQTYLYQNKIQSAAEEAKLALQIDPTDEGAQKIYLQSLKAKNPIYWLFWKWTLLCTRLGGTYSLFFVFGIWGFVNLLNTIRKASPDFFNNHPNLDTALSYFFVFYVLFCIYTWVANPIFSFFAKRGYLK